MNPSSHLCYPQLSAEESSELFGDGRDIWMMRKRRGWGPLPSQDQGVKDFLRKPPELKVVGSNPTGPVNLTVL